MLPRRGMKGVAATLGLACLLAASMQACVIEQEVDDAPVLQQGPGGKADDMFADGPLYLTGAFDGSKRFGMWVDTMDFARGIERDYGKPLSFTYFINTCYLDTSVTGSWIGKSLSDSESTVRMALMQQAINEGHEIANHAVRHQDGTHWSYDQWHAEIAEFHQLVERNLFRPIYGPGGEPVFPRWEPMAQAEDGQVGAACATDGDCDSGICLAVSKEASFCSDGCNKHNPCANGTICGAPDWNESKDRCVPMPAFPVDYQGQELFDATGAPNLEHPALKPIKLTGFRAPQLGHNKALFQVLDQFHYRYDTSKILQIGAPKRVAHGDQVFHTMYEFALMKNSGSFTVSMDYNYKVNSGSYERMRDDYQRSIVDAYNARKRTPWNIGHHFALWRNGGYWQAMQDAFVFAAQGCPDGQGNLQCEQVEFPNFNDLALILDSKADGMDDPFADPTAEGEVMPPTEWDDHDEEI